MRVSRETEIGEDTVMVTETGEEAHQGHYALQLCMCFLSFIIKL